MTLTGNTFFFPWEPALMEWLQTTLGSAAISVISFFSVFGEEIALIAILGFVYWCYNKEMGKTVGLGIVMAMVWNPMIKNIALRRRPYFDHEGIKILRIVDPEADALDIAAQGYSFPSGHSTNVAVSFGSLAVQNRKKWLTALAIIVPLLVGFSRVVVGAHYPTDVIAGWLLGVCSMLIVSFLQKKVRNTKLLYLILLLCAVPGFFYCKSTDYFSSMGLLIGFMAGMLFEEKYVHFENTRRPLQVILRILGGGLVYFALNKLLKMPFSKEFLDSGSMAALLVRCARYAVIGFVDLGVYPMIFPLFDRIGKKQNHQGE